MAKTLVDIDTELLAQAAQLLGTTTKKDTVNRALGEVVRSERLTSLARRSFDGLTPQGVTARRRARPPR